jgi:hypothetical protein
MRTDVNNFLMKAIANRVGNGKMWYANILDPLGPVNPALERNDVQFTPEGRCLAMPEEVLEVLPVSKAFSGIDLEGDVAEFGNNFEALENLRKLAFSSDVDEPAQLQFGKPGEPRL